MKKVVPFILACMLVFSLAACGGGSSSGGGMADGVYTAQADDAYAEANHGWRDTLTVTYEGGVIVAAEFESYNTETGAKKSEATAEEYPMTPAPADWIPELSQNIVDGGDADHITAVTGATNASNAAKALLAAIQTEGKPGETITVTIPTE